MKVHQLSPPLFIHDRLTASLFSSLTVDLLRSDGLFLTSASPASLIVLYAPVIQLQPASNVQLALSTSLSLSVQAEAFPEPVFQWFRNGVLLADQNKSSLLIVHSDLSTQGTYYVVISNSQGQVISSTTLVVVNYPPLVQSQPRNIIANPGATITLSITASGSPFPAIQWMKNGVKIRGANVLNYIIYSATPSDQAAYSAILTNSLGTVSTSTAYVTINEPPTIIDQPMSLILNRGEAAFFQVNATASPPPAFYWMVIDGN